MPRARAVGAVTGGAGMMAGLDQVPIWPRGGRWGERRASDGADGRKRVFVFLRFCTSWRYNQPERLGAAWRQYDSF